MTNDQINPKPQFSIVWVFGFGVYLEIGHWSLGF